MQTTKYSSKEEKKATGQIVFEAMSEALFDRINYLNNPGLVTSTATTSTSNYKTAMRVTDSSQGKYLKVDKPARFRGLFYVTGGAEAAEFNILSLSRYNIDSIAADIASFGNFDSFVGINVNRGRVSMVSLSGNTTRLVKTNYIWRGTVTNQVEIFYNVNSASCFINDEFVGSIDCDLQRKENDMNIIFPLFGPIRSLTGVSVNLNCENYQFIQEK